MNRAVLQERIPRLGRLPGRIRGPIRGDHDLNPEFAPGAALRDAAVLVPLIERAEGLTILLTQRTAHLASHAGQIAFPGGCAEPEDASAMAAALRETEEELGLPPERVEILGQLDTYVTRTGYRIEPFVGMIRAPVILNPDPNEVADTFEVPLDFVLRPGNPKRHSRMFEGKERRFYAFPWPGRYIWGATAGILHNLKEALAD